MRVAQLRARIERWRGTRAKRSPMPAELWTAATEVAQELGAYRVARELRIGYGTLKERLSAVATATEGGRTNLLIYHGAFAPRGCARQGPWDWLACRPKPSRRPERGPAPAADSSGEPAEAVAGSVTPRIGAAVPGPGDERGEATAAVARPPPGYSRPRHVPWAELLRRVFEIPPSLKLRRAS